MRRKGTWEKWRLGKLDTIEHCVISYKVFNALEYGVYLGSSGMLREQIDTAFSVATDTAQRH